MDISKIVITKQETADEIEKILSALVDNSIDKEKTNQLLLDLDSVVNCHYRALYLLKFKTELQTFESNFLEATGLKFDDNQAADEEVHF